MLKSVPHFKRRTVSPHFNSQRTLQEQCPREVGWRQGWRRAIKFARGQWADLLEELCHSTHSSRLGVTRSKDSTCGVQPLDEKDAGTKKTRGGSVQQGEAGQVSRARQAFDRCNTGPWNVGRRWRSCNDADRKSRSREIPPEVMTSKPDTCGA